MSLPDVRVWLDEHTSPAEVWFTVTDVTELLVLYLKLPVKRRTVYTLCQNYVSILGIEVERRMRSNFNEQVFSREQLAELMEAYVGWKIHHRKYVKVFQEMRSVREGRVPASSSQVISPSSSPTASGGPSDPALVQLLTDLRGEVAQLRGQVAQLETVVTHLGQDGRGVEGGNGVSLEEMRRLLSQLFWRGSVTTVNLSHPDGLEKVESLMEYLGVPSPDDEGVQMQELGVDEVFEKIVKAAAKDDSEDEQAH